MWSPLQFSQILILKNIKLCWLVHLILCMRARLCLCICKCTCVHENMCKSGRHWTCVSLYFCVSTFFFFLKQSRRFNKPPISVRQLYTCGFFLFLSTFFFRLFFPHTYLSWLWRARSPTIIYFRLLSHHTANDGSARTSLSNSEAGYVLKCWITNNDFFIAL